MHFGCVIFIQVLFLASYGEDNVLDPWKDEPVEAKDVTQDFDPVAEMKRLYEEEIRFGEQIRAEEALTDPDFDPLEEMKKLWEEEVKEGQEFKDSLRALGVDVEEWEKKFNHEDWGEGEVPEEILQEVTQATHTEL